MYKILIVDDEPLAREYLRVVLPGFFEETELELFDAADGIEATEFFLKNTADIVITDIRMPERDGMELAEILHHQYPDVFILLLSGYEELEYAHSAIRFGVTDYLLKPIVLEELSVAMKQLQRAVDQQRARQITQHAALALSKNYYNLITQNLIDAAAHQENLKIRTYYELAYELKLPLIEGEGVILLFQISLEQMLANEIPIHTLSVYQMILLQRITELLKSQQSYDYAMPNRDGGTLVCLMGTDAEELMARAETLFQMVSTSMNETTGLTPYAGIGEPVNDILQLDNSYQQAVQALVQHLIIGKNALYQFSERGWKLEELADYFSTLLSYRQKSNRTALLSRLQQYVQKIPNFQPATVLRFLSFWISCLYQSAGEQSRTHYERALHLLEESVVSNGKGIWTINTISELLYRFLLLFFGEDMEEPLDGSQVVTVGQHYIRSHFAEPLSLSLISEKVGVTESYFSNIFHREMGETYTHFLTRTRMENAVEILRENPQMKIYEVAKKVGYVSVKHFNHIFKQWYGVPPNKYQKINFPPHS